MVKKFRKVLSWFINIFIDKFSKESERDYRISSIINDIYSRIFYGYLFHLSSPTSNLNFSKIFSFPKSEKTTISFFSCFLHFSIFAKYGKFRASAAHHLIILINSSWNFYNPWTTRDDRLKNKRKANETCNSSLLLKFVPSCSILIGDYCFGYHAFALIHDGLSLGGIDSKIGMGEFST